MIHVRISGEEPEVRRAINALVKSARECGADVDGASRVYPNKRDPGVRCYCTISYPGFKRDAIEGARE